MADLEELVAQVEDRPLSEPDKQQMWRQIRSARDEATRTQPRPARRSIYVAAPALAAAALLGFWWFGGGDPPTTEQQPVAEAPRAPAALTLADGAALGPYLRGLGEVSEEMRVALADGSALVLQPGAALTVVDNGDDALRLHLVTGRATFEVEPGGPRRWSVDAGLALVEVVGTVFTVERRETWVATDVARGQVRVSGHAVPGGAQLLTHGESLTVGARPAQDEVVAAMPPEAPTETASRSLRTHSWRDLAEARDHDEAFGVLGDAGISHETQRAEDAETLLLLADVARLSGHPRSAVPPLTRVLEAHRGDTHAPAAAFTLGRLQLDTFGDAAAAAERFEETIALGAPSVLREDAYLRLVEARAQLGQRAAVTRAARDYLAAFPQGRHAEAVLSVLAEQ